MEIVWLCIYNTIEFKYIFKSRELSCESHVAHNTLSFVRKLFNYCACDKQITIFAQMY